MAGDPSEVTLQSQELNPSLVTAGPISWTASCAAIQYDFWVLCHLVDNILWPRLFLLGFCDTTHSRCCHQASLDSHSCPGSLASVWSPTASQILSPFVSLICTSSDVQKCSLLQYHKGARPGRGKTWAEHRGAQAAPWTCCSLGRQGGCRRVLS